MKFSSILFILVIIGFFGKVHAQNKLRLNYYADETLEALAATLEQQTQIKRIKSNTDSKIGEVKANLGLSEDEKKEKYAEIYREGAQRYNQIITDEQRTIIRKMLLDIQTQNQIAGEIPAMDSRTYDSKHYQERMALFNTLAPVSGAIVFLGNSITERGQWHELFPRQIISNRGIGGDNVFGILARLDDIIASKPKKLFLMVGTNDLASRSWPVDFVYEKYVEIVDEIIEKSPKTQLYIQSVLPLNESIITIERFKGKSIFIEQFNGKLKTLAREKGLTFVDVYSQMCDAKGQLKAIYTNDGIHLTPLAYEVWAQHLINQNYL